MTATNNFLPFASTGTPNVVTQGVYAGLTSRTNGFVSGITPSNVANKAWRQGSLMAAVMGQVIVDVLNVDAIDDGTTATLTTNFKLAMTALSSAGSYAATSGTNTINVILAPVPGTLASLTGQMLRLKKSGTQNSNAVTLNPNGLGATPVVHGDGSALTSGELPASGVFTVIFDGTNFVLQSIGYLPVTTGYLTSQLSAYATLASPTFSGNPKAPTGAPLDGGINIATQAYADASATAAAALVAFQTGMMALWPTAGAPAGFRECDGSHLSTTGTYATLFAVIGYTFGGSGATFWLPDMRGMFARGWDNGAGVDPARAIGSYQGDEFQDHIHTAHGTAGGKAAFGSDIYGLDGVENTSGPTTGNHGSETRPKNIALMYIIKI